MIRTLLTVASLVAGGAGVATGVHFASIPPPQPAPLLPPAATAADLQALRQEVAAMADEVARQYSAMSKISNAIHDDLMRAEAERARARAADNAVTQRYHNDAAQFLKAVPR